MSDDFTGSNTDSVLRERAQRRVEKLDEIAGLQAELADFKAEDKADGFSEKALGQCIKELRKGIEYQCDQLTLELELHTYRRAVGLPVDLETAQKGVRAEIEDAPKPKRGQVKQGDGKRGGKGGLQ